MSEPPPPAALPDAPRGGLAGLGRKLFLVRGWVYLPFAAAAMLIPASERPGAEVLWPAGIALMVLGVALRLASIRRIGGAARTKKNKAKRVIDSGPYGWTRNPLYIANTSAFLGFLLLCRLPWFALASWVLLWCWYHAIARYEETVLAGLFGPEFDDYRRRVPLWIPRPPKSPPAEDPEDLYPWGKLLRRERGALLNVMGMIGLAAVKQWWWR
jgi:protein-S-isoprenylcysteine O-methyltransferase Ste14